MSDLDNDLYGLDGEPISWEQWISLSREKRSVAKTDINGVATVSTIWLGLNHNWLPTGPPLIFETMVFSKDETVDMQCRRWPTIEIALAGHDQLVEETRKRLGVDPPASDPRDDVIRAPKTP